MRRGLLKGLLGSLEEAAAAQPDNRQPSNGTKYRLQDALKSALAVFYFLHPSLLNFMQTMRRKHKRDNLATLFGVEEVPGASQMKVILDGIDPKGLAGVFDDGLEMARERGVLEQYRVLDGELPVAVDGTWYFSSGDIRCPHCLHMMVKTKQGEKTIYYHDVLAAAVVKYDTGIVLPLFPEFIRNEDGNEKQDCERNAMKRWLTGREEELKRLNPIFLGDDLYACHSICEEIVSRRMHFIFTCKDESHPWIAGEVKDAPFERTEWTEWNGRNHLVHTVSWLNGLDNRADGQTLRVNYLSYRIENREKGKTTYHNTWITDKRITGDNAREMASDQRSAVARSRWKIENEHNNVLKHRGYNLQHNFGHGENHASEMFCLLNLLSFLIHGLQDWMDEEYQKARASFGRRDEFFWSLRYEMSHYLHEDWHSLFLRLSGEGPDP
jgi:hypothetical protein